MGMTRAMSLTKPLGLYSSSSSSGSWTPSRAWEKAVHRSQAPKK
jgi:hypothetical protein